MSALNPKGTVAELKELRCLTGDDNGAQRVAFTPTWLKAREWLQSKVAALQWRFTTMHRLISLDAILSPEEKCY